ncbi:archaellar assembly protein FlaJ [Haloprofundus salinisoli]|uniref:archaellar assembly protein FlaJ n=1 Tax=Haloprofundus salinisoli TaxID=2876193 RepID=UPI001CCD13AB|nr:archaellar assembly protein FlaJ [Haloprofundus salinisoli]
MDGGSGGDVAREESESQFDFQQMLESLERGYYTMEMPYERYLFLMLLPALLFGQATFIAVLALEPELAVSAPLVLLSFFVPGVALVYPQLVHDRKRKDTREKFYLFITHITVLSTTNIDRVEIFRTLAREEEYGAIAEEMGRIVALVDTWNQSLDDACRMRAKFVASPLMEDFLERLAYSVGAGQHISEFLLNEQDSIIQSYTTRYGSQLDRLGLVKDVYMSVNLSVTFGLVFAIVIPFLIGINPTAALIAVIFGSIFVQVMFLYAMNSIAPKDPVWFQSEISLERNVRIRTSLVVGAGLSLALTAVCYAALQGMLPIDAGKIPLPLYVAIPFTPLFLPGVVMQREEKRVKNRDEGFPSFIRALGAVESVKQSSTSSVLASLRKKDFGALTANISNLYRRLNMRIDSQLSWTYFSAETGSFLIQKFSDMYVKGRQMGGEPRQLGTLISRNMTAVLNLRRKRSQEVGTVLGVLYGVVLSSTFAYYVALEVVRVLKDISTQMDVDSNIVGSLLNPSVYTMPEIEFLLLVAIVVNSFFASMIIRVIGRGHSMTSLPHFALLVWSSSIVAVITSEVVSSLVAF